MQTKFLDSVREGDFKTGHSILEKMTPCHLNLFSIR